jgi:catechol 2,3-dioxygenase
MTTPSGGSLAGGSLPDATRLGRVALSVKDLGETIDFYRDVVGLAVIARRDAAATLGVDGTPLLELRRDDDAAARTAEQAGLFHSAFRVPSRAALGAALERIREGWTLEGASDHRVSEALYLTDPEGNGVEVYRDRPRERWPRTDDGGVRMATLPLDLDDVASESDGATDAPAGTTLGHVHLEATSIASAREFYVDALGLDVMMDAGSALFLAAGRYHHHVGVNTWNGRSEPASGRGLAWFEVVVPDADAVESARRRLSAAGVDVVERDSAATGHGSAIEFADPDGIGIRLRAE